MSPQVSHEITQGLSSGRTQRAFTLVEVLVAIIVLAVGMLGLASLQLAGMRNSHSSALRTQATIAAADLLDRMRAAPAAFVGQTFESAAGDADTKTTVAAFNAWANSLREQLPAPKVAKVGEPPTAGARGAVDCTASNRCGAGNCAVAVRWDDSRVEGDRASAAGTSTTALGADERQSLEFVTCSRLAEGL